MKCQYCTDGLVIDVSKSRGFPLSSPQSFVRTLPCKSCTNYWEKNRGLISVGSF